MKKFVKENWFRLILAICALVIAFGYLWSVKIDQDREDRLFYKSIDIDLPELDLPILPELPNH